MAQAAARGPLRIAVRLALALTSVPNEAAHPSYTIRKHVIIETAFAALLFAGVFLMGGRLHPFASLGVDRRVLVSFGSGMAAAYVFVHLMPELHGAREAFAESVSFVLRYEGIAIYFTALLGFLVFYGFEHLMRRSRESDEREETENAFRFHLGGFAVYVAVMGYLLVHNLEETSASTALFAVAIGFHFLAVDHELREEHGRLYEDRGRFFLAGSAIAGWSFALLIELPHTLLALLVAFVSGAVIINATVMELPSEKDGRFLPFLAGGILYGLVLMPVA